MKKSKFISLISGGKDSIFSIAIAKCYGFHLVAAAHLVPQDMGKDDTESYMYQGTGHECVPSIARCLGVPLYQRKAKGVSKVVSMHYKMDPEDEVEDLYDILKEVVDDYPGVEFVSCGAIRSDYQRHRVEEVCQRLGLRCLAFLWGENQQRLLRRIVDSKTEAILVKVAAEGLKEKHVGQSLGALEPELLQLKKTVGIHPCGEGGEFETITLNSPAFQDHYISIVRSAVRVLTMDQYAPVCVLDILEHQVEEIPKEKRIEFRESFLKLQEFYKSGLWMKDLISQGIGNYEDQERKDEIYFPKIHETEFTIYSSCVTLYANSEVKYRPVANGSITGVEVIDCKGLILPWEVTPDPETVPFVYEGHEKRVAARSVDIGISLASSYFIRIVCRCFHFSRKVSLTLTLPKSSESQEAGMLENWKKRAASSISLIANEEKIILQEIKIDIRFSFGTTVQCSGFGLYQPDA